MNLGVPLKETTRWMVHRVHSISHSLPIAPASKGTGWGFCEGVCSSAYAAKKEPPPLANCQHSAGAGGEAPGGCVAEVRLRQGLGRHGNKLVMLTPKTYTRPPRKGDVPSNSAG